ncbi:hypothetical protein FBU30_005829 [Linnemannia zychae]|nr:hypothetical protein FBU30_005829 [Linnemannia zychae]
MAKAQRISKINAPRSKRLPTAYNLYIKNELPKYKAAHPNVEHKKAFKQVAYLWKDAPENPNRMPS